MNFSSPTGNEHLTVPPQPCRTFLFVIFIFDSWHSDFLFGVTHLCHKYHFQRHHAAVSAHSDLSSACERPDKTTGLTHQQQTDLQSTEQ